MTAQIACPVCKLDAEHVKWLPHPPGHDIDCSRCGRFFVSETVVATRRSQPPDYALSAWIRHHNEVAGPPKLTTDQVANIQRAARAYSVSERQMQFLQALERASTTVGKKVHVMQEFDFVLAHCTSVEELNYVIRALMGRNFVHLDKYSDPEESFSIDLTIAPEGWAHLEKQPATTNTSRQAFVAMSFAPELVPAWQHGISPAILKAGFQPYRVDATPHIDRIDSKIITEIENSRFVVADVTHQRPGVYFEAGFAVGVGLPVFWCVRRDDLPNVHFDTRQYNHIVWDNEAELSEKLETFIVSVIGRHTAISRSIPDLPRRGGQLER